MTSYLGEFAGLMTSVCWSFTSIFFTLSGREVGSPLVNRTRLLFALGMVSLTHWVARGQLLPLDAGYARWGWMGLSGIVGFVLGDAMLFQAFVMIGPRLSSLLMALNPVIGTILAWFLLHETLSVQEVGGILLAVGGVIWVVLDRQNGPSEWGEGLRRSYVIGVLLGLGGAFGQAAGLIVSKKGLEGDFSAMSGNLMRLFISTTVIWGAALANGKARTGFRTLRDHPRASRFILGGAVAGPFVGVWMSLIAVQHAPVGIAATLMSLTPIILLPSSRFFFAERITWRAVSGTLLAMLGIAILFL